MRETLRHLVAFIEPGQRSVWLGLALLTFVVTGIEVVAALLIFDLTRHLADITLPMQLPVLGQPRAWFYGLGDRQPLMVAAAMIAFFFLLRAATVLLQSYLRARVAERAGVRLSSRLFRGYLRMPYAFHLNRNSAELIRNVNDAVKDVIDYTLIPSLRITSEVLVIAGLGLVLILMAPLAAALAAILFIPLIALMFGVVQPRIAALGQISHEMGRWTLGSLQQSLHGFREIALLGRREHFSERYDKVREQIGRTRYLRQALGDVPRVVLETGLVLFVAVFIIAAAATGKTTQESLGVLAMFAYTALRVLPSVSRVVLQLNDLKYGAAAAADVYRELAAIENAPDIEPPRHSECPNQPDTTARMSFCHSLRLESVSYRYPETGDDALSDITFEIPKGGSLGIVGQTGAGKSTLLDVILGLLPATRGRVLVDDVDIRTNVEGWQLNLGVVPQTVYLLDATMRANVAFGVDACDVDEERVWEAVRLARLESFVAALPAGLDTRVGERGVRISGGERQRVAIARALYRRPPVLILDEGTSALDSTTEAELLRGLEPLRRDRTVIVVAHRLTTVRDCDRILLIESGRLAEAGSFEELFERNAAFRQLARSQARSTMAHHSSPIH